MSAVQPGRAVALTYGLVVKQLVTRGRILALTLVGAVVVLVAILVGGSEADVDELERGVRLISNLGFTMVVPVVSLVFASAALGDMREDGTLVYLWLRPMDRWPVVVGSWLAAITLSLPITLVPLVISALAVNGGGLLTGATVLAGVAGVLSYSALFVLVGLLLKNPIVWGLGYILIWEGLAAQFFGSLAKLAIRGYTRSIITSRTGVDLELGDLSLTMGIVVPLVVTVVAIVLASARLQSMEVA
jgi:ABC-2 type transport system permease protein